MKLYRYVTYPCEIGLFTANIISQITIIGPAFAVIVKATVVAAMVLATSREC